MKEGKLFSRALRVNFYSQNRFGTLCCRFPFLFFFFFSNQLNSDQIEQAVMTSFSQPILLIKSKLFKQRQCGLYVTYPKNNSSMTFSNIVTALSAYMKMFKKQNLLVVVFKSVKFRLIGTSGDEKFSTATSIT